MKEKYEKQQKKNELLRLKKKYYQNEPYTDPLPKRSDVAKQTENTSTQNQPSIFVELPRGLKKRREIVAKPIDDENEIDDISKDMDDFIKEIEKPGIPESSKKNQPESPPKNNLESSPKNQHESPPKKQLESPPKNQLESSPKNICPPEKEEEEVNPYAFRSDFKRRSNTEVTFSQYRKKD